MIIAVARDITERRRAEQELRRVNRALRTISELNQCWSSSRMRLSFAEVCRIIVEVGGYSLAWVGFAEQDGKKSVRRMAAAGGHEDYLKGLQITWGKAIRVWTRRGMRFEPANQDLSYPGSRYRSVLAGSRPWRPRAWSMALPLTANAGLLGLEHLRAGAGGLRRR